MEELSGFIHYSDGFSYIGTDSLDMWFPEKVLVDDDAKEFCLFHSFNIVTSIRIYKIIIIVRLM